MICFIEPAFTRQREDCRRCNGPLRPTRIRLPPAGCINPPAREPGKIAIDARPICTIIWLFSGPDGFIRKTNSPPDQPLTSIFHQLRSCSGRSGTGYPKKMPLNQEQNSSRLLFIDTVRAYACLMMVFGHLVNEMIHHSLRNTFLYENWQHLRGLTAPTFLFVSGFAFYVATSRHWEEYLGWTPRLRKRLFRIFMLLLVGYTLHLPVRNPLDLFSQELTEAQWRTWLNVDILQCVAGTLLLLHVLILILRTRRRFLAAAAVLMPLIFLASPLIWRINGNASQPGFFNYFLGGNFDSFFPLVPWTGFNLAGLLAGYWHQQVWQGRPGWHRRFFYATLALAAGGGLLYLLYFLLPDSYQFKTLQAQSLWLRLACVLFIFTLISYFSRRLRKIPDFVRIIGMETLTIYWLHLVIIYGSAWNTGLAPRFSGALTLPQCILLFAVLFTLLATTVVMKNLVMRRLVPAVR